MSNDAFKMFMSNEFWSAIAGAVAGGGISYILQKQNLNEARTMRALEEKEKNTSIFNFMMIKTLKMHAHYANLNATFVELKGKIPGIGPIQPWQFYGKIGNIPGPIEISPDEMSLFMKFKEDDAVNLLISAGESLAFLIECIHQLNSISFELRSKITVSDSHKAKTVSYIDKTQMIQLNPLIHNLNELFIHTDSYIDENLRKADRLVNLVHNAGFRHLGIDYKLSDIEAKI